MLREAAVLVPVYRRQDGELMVVLVRRAQGGAHGGQLALPGGQREPGDADLAATALREANEELGLAANQVELLAALPVVETQTTGFRVAPFLGPAGHAGALAASGAGGRRGGGGAGGRPGPARGARRGGPRIPDLAGAAAHPTVASRRPRGLGGDLPDPGAAGPTTPGR